MSLAIFDHLNIFEHFLTFLNMVDHFWTFVNIGLTEDAHTRHDLFDPYNSFEHT